MSTPRPLPDLAARLRAARSYAGLTQKELAARLEIDEQTVKRSERGARTPRVPELRAIAHETGMPFTFFYVDLLRLDELMDEERGRLVYRQLEDRDVLDSRGVPPAERARRIREAMAVLEEFAEQAEEEAATTGEGADAGSRHDPLRFGPPPAQDPQPEPQGEGEDESVEGEPPPPA